MQNGASVLADGAVRLPGVVGTRSSGGDAVGAGVRWPGGRGGADGASRVTPRSQGACLARRTGLRPLVRTVTLRRMRSTRVPLLLPLLLAACGATPEPPVRTAEHTGAEPDGPAEQELCDGDAGRAARFTCRVAEALRARITGFEVRESAAFTILVQTPEGEGVLQANLDNLWNGCEQTPDQCDAAIDYYAEAAAQTLEQLETPAQPTRENLRAVLKSEHWLRDIEAQTPDPEQNGILARPFVGDIVVVYVIDMPNSMRALTRGELAELGLDEEELDRLALANLEAALTEFPRRPVREGSGLGSLQAGDSYEGSRLLLHDRWAAIADEVEGDLLVAVPSRDLVLYAGAGRADDVENLRLLAAEMARRDPYPVSAQVLRWTDTGWEPFTP